MVPGISPLVGSYGQWVAGRQLAPGLPRPMSDFLAGAFGPLSPITPMPIDTPEDSGRAGPRRLQYPVGWNLPVGQPGTEGYKLAPFSVLYKYADIYSVGRACINIRRDEMAGLSWDIGATADAQAVTKGDKGAVKDQRERAQKIVKWFKKIDSNYYGFQNWFTACLEQQIVIDALSLYLAPTRVNGKGLFGSDLAEAQLLDGSTIRPLYDLSGAKPRPPAPAYQQYLYGVPRSEYIAIMNDDDLDEMEDNLRDAGVDENVVPEKEYRGDQLLYLPRLPRINSPYGYSMVEQALIPITLGMLRQNYLIDYYGEGSIPGTFVIAGSQYVTPAQQRQLQDTLNAIAGDTAWKHRIIVLPPESKSEPQKNMDGQWQMDQMVAEQVAMIAHIQPHELGMLPGGKSGGLSGGKGVAQEQQASVAEQRTEPDRKWWKETFFDYVIQDAFQQEDLEWKWLDFEEDEDDQKKAQTQSARVFAGLTCIDQERVENGDDAWNLPLTQSPFIMQGGQIVPLDPSIPPPAPPAPPGGGMPGGVPGPAGTALSAALQPELGKNPDKPKNNPAAALLSDKKKDRKKGRKELANRFADNLQAVTKHPPAQGQPNAVPGAPTATQGAVPPQSGTPTPPPAKPDKKGKIKAVEPDLVVDGWARLIAEDKLTVADLVKAKIKYKDSKLPEIVYSYLCRSYPAKDVEWALDPDIKWEYDPKVKLSDINMARRPGGRNPKKVEAVSDSLDQGASMDPIVLVESDTPDPAGLTIADGWHRTLGAEDAGWDKVPAFVGHNVPDKYTDTITGAMQRDSDSKKAAQMAEIGVLNRYLRKGGDIARFKPAALDPVQMRLLTDDLARMERDAALGAARDRIKSISLSAPLATGVVPFDLDGQHDNPLDFDMAGAQGEDRRCPRCSAPMTKFERGPLCTNCRVGDLAGGSEFKRQKTNTLLAKVEAELLKRGVNPLTALDESATLTKYSADQPRDDHGRFGSGSTLNMDNLADQVREPDSGFTIDLKTGKSPTDGYIVAIDGHSGKFPHEKFLNDREYRTQAIKGWLKENAKEFKPAGRMMGGWHDPEHGDIILDVVERHATLEGGMAAGKAGNQISMYDVVNNKTIPTGGTGGY